MRLSFRMQSDRRVLAGTFTEFIGFGNNANLGVCVMHARYIPITEVL